MSLPNPSPPDRRPQARRGSLTDARSIAISALRHETREVAGSRGWAEVATRVCGRFRDRVADLVGLDGFGAMHRRALYLSQDEFPFLVDVGARSAADSMLEGLGDALEKQTASRARAAVVSLVTNLIWLLVIFVGPGVAAPLLRDILPEVPVADPTPPEREEMP